MRDPLECVWPAALETANYPFRSRTWAAAMWVVLDRDNAHLTRTRRLGLAGSATAVRREITKRGGQRACLRIVRKLFAALCEPSDGSATRNELDAIDFGFVRNVVLSGAPEYDGRFHREGSRQGDCSISPADPARKWWTAGPEADYPPFGVSVRRSGPPCRERRAGTCRAGLHLPGINIHTPVT